MAGEEVPIKKFTCDDSVSALEAYYDLRASWTGVRVEYLDGNYVLTCHEEPVGTAITTIEVSP